MRSGAIIVFGLLGAVIAVTVMAAAVPRWRRRLAMVAGLGAAGILGAYLVGRGAAEFFVVHYSDPASYRNDWGGPSLAGVFAVHSGPGLAVLIAAGTWLLRRHRGRRRMQHGAADGTFKGTGTALAASGRERSQAALRAFSLAKRDT